MDRIYQTIIEDHIANYQQMLFLAGPRQVGKTTIGLALKQLPQRFTYLDWDKDKDKELILQGIDAVATYAGIMQLEAEIPIIVFDEIHKYRRWKTFLKGFYDSYKGKAHIIVTGSAKLNLYRAGGDSMMGRYFLYRVHPLSVAECLTATIHKQEIRKPKAIAIKDWQRLFEFGGYPEPFLKKDKRFLQRWKSLRTKQLFREDIRDLTNIQELGQLEILASLLNHQSGQLLNLSNLARKMAVTVNTIKRWLNTLENFYYCFLIKPWTKNITRSLIKEPKLYLWDWTDITDTGNRVENFVASHLLKAVHFWTDNGFGKYDLYFLRDKEKREVDFLVTKNEKPWFLVEVKNSNNTSLSKNLTIFQKQTKAEHAFQAAFDLDYVDRDCFEYNTPIIVPAKTFLSQLV
jgi:predicted AAA+ superfamily ATPase